jgi:hypothetical protein
MVSKYVISTRDGLIFFILHGFQSPTNIFRNVVMEPLQMTLLIELDRVDSDLD